eukprot:2383628-Prymnesium_polylepis.1
MRLAVHAIPSWYDEWSSGTWQPSATNDVEQQAQAQNLHDQFGDAEDGDGITATQAEMQFHRN